MRRAVRWSVGVWVLAGVAVAAPSRLNEAVLEVAQSYEDGGGYDRSWTGSGVPEAIEHDGETILRASEGGTYCCGFTFAVAVRAAREAGLLEGKTAADLRRFQRAWYGAVEDEDVRERQVQAAVELLEIGEAVMARRARPGDFLQLWRTSGSGHSVVFLGWITEARRPVGIRYRSSQGSTGGVGDSEERFEGCGGSVDPERLYFARLGG